MHICFPTSINSQSPYTLILTTMPTLFYYSPARCFTLLHYALSIPLLGLIVWTGVNFCSLFHNLSPFSQMRKSILILNVLLILLLSCTFPPIPAFLLFWGKVGKERRRVKRTIRTGKSHTPASNRNDAT